MIAEALRQYAVPIDVPQLHPQNTRIGDVENIRASLRRFGQVRPILVQKSTGFVVAGNHTLKGMREEAEPEVAVLAVDLSDEEALAYLIADNRLGQLGGFDDAGLAAQLETMMLNGKLEGTGYTPDQVDDMLAGLDALPTGDPEPTEAEHGVSQEELAERFRNRSQVALRQFVLMYDQDTAATVEAMFRKLERAWGMSGARDVVREALMRACAEPPIEGLTPEEAARANAPEPDEPAA